MPSAPLNLATDLVVPPAIEALARACHDAGGRAWLVGGCVRDGLLGLPVKDYDIEVHHLDADALARVLRRFGRVDEVGRSFGVFKLALHPRWKALDLHIDVSLPRHDSQSGRRHKDIRVEGDPHMGLREAARRRDLTVNAIAFDPIDRRIEDPWGGLEDLGARRLRAVDEHTFGEDPLRVLRVVQLAARFDFKPIPELLELCAATDLSHLPAERVWMEVEKLLLRAPRPSVGLRVGRRTGAWRQVLPELVAEPARAVDDAVDRAAEVREQVGRPPRDVALMLTALFHALDSARVESALDRLNVHTMRRYPVRQRVLEAVANWPKLVEPMSDTTLRGMADHAEVALVAWAAWAVTGAPAAREATRRAAELGVLHEPLPHLLRGRDLARLGMRPGPAMGRLLAQVREAQIAGKVESYTQALDFARKALRGSPPNVT